MSANANLISCNLFTYPSPTNYMNTNHRIRFQHNRLEPIISAGPTGSKWLNFSKTCNPGISISKFQRKGHLQICHSLLGSEDLGEKDSAEEVSSDGKLKDNDAEGEGRDWTSSILLGGLWGGLMYYVFFLTPNQTPMQTEHFAVEPKGDATPAVFAVCFWPSPDANESMDMYLLKKLLNLAGEDGFKLNDVVLSLWYIMGLWPLVYSMLLLPSGRSSNSKIPVWPFLVLSCFGGAYVLLPYFVLWNPPPPAVNEAQLRTWPLNILESKITAVISLAAGVVLISFAGLANGDVWKEFFQYFRQSKFIHATSIDFCLFSAFAPFWVYNDMTSRKWFHKGSWLLPISLVPLLGPSLYLLLRPSFPAVANPNPTKAEPK